MYYLIGQVKTIDDKSIILQNNNVGYEIQLLNKFNLKENDEIKVYIYQDSKLEKNNKFIQHLYGFLTQEKYCLFLVLITVPNIGPKTALNILKNDINLLLEIIKTENLFALSNLQGLNLRLANFLLDESKKSKKFKEILKNIEIRDNFSHISIEQTNKIDENDLFSALKSIGYSNQDIKNSILLFKLDEELTANLDEAVSKCIKIIISNNDKDIKNQKKIN